MAEEIKFKEFKSPIELEIIEGIKRVIKKIKSLSAEIQLSALKALFFGNGEKWQGLRQTLNTYCLDPNGIDKDPSESGQVRKQLDLLSKLNFDGFMTKSSTSTPYKVLVKVILRDTNRILTGNYESDFGDGEIPERIFILRGFIFGPGTNLLSDRYQGLKQALVTAEHSLPESEANKKQTWKQISLIEGYLNNSQDQLEVKSLADYSDFD